MSSSLLWQIFKITGFCRKHACYIYSRTWLDGLFQFRCQCQQFVQRLTYSNYFLTDVNLKYMRYMVVAALAAVFRYLARLPVANITFSVQVKTKGSTQSRKDEMQSDVTDERERKKKKTHHHCSRVCLNVRGLHIMVTIWSIVVLCRSKICI